jgi:hypothetical protein
LRLSKKSLALAAASSLSLSFENLPVTPPTMVDRDRKCVLESYGGE